MVRFSPERGLNPGKPSIWFSLLLLFTLVSHACTSSPDPEIITLTDEEARQDAEQNEQEISVTLPDDLDVSLWASQRLMSDPVAIHMDNQGRALITVTRRSRGSEFDIRDVHS